MKSLIRITAPLMLAGLAVAGCASDNAATFQTNSVNAPPAAVAAPRISPECQTLAQQIDTLRREGTLERLEKASAGKGATVPVKREALVKQASYNKLTADFQTRCGPTAVMNQIQQQQTLNAARAAAGTSPAPVAVGNGG